MSYRGASPVPEDAGLPVPKEEAHSQNEHLPLAGRERWEDLPPLERFPIVGLGGEQL